jgi:predicted nuclease with TOPRIM domain
MSNLPELRGQLGEHALQLRALRTVSRELSSSVTEVDKGLSGLKKDLKKTLERLEKLSREGEQSSDQVLSLQKRWQAREETLKLIRRQLEVIQDAHERLSERVAEVEKRLTKASELNTAASVSLEDISLQYITRVQAEGEKLLIVLEGYITNTSAADASCVRLEIGVSSLRGYDEDGSLQYSHRPRRLREEFKVRNLRAGESRPLLLTMTYQKHRFGRRVDLKWKADVQVKLSLP